MSKVLFFTTTDDTMSKGCALLIYSLKKHIPNFDDYDIKVVYNNLSDENKKMISDIHDKVIFESFINGIETNNNFRIDLSIVRDTFKQRD